MSARDRLMPLVYRELRRRTAAHLRRERRGPHAPVERDGQAARAWLFKTLSGARHDA